MAASSSVRMTIDGAAAARTFEMWKATPIGERKVALIKAADIIEAEADGFATLFVKEQGRPYPGTRVPAGTITEALVAA